MVFALKPGLKYSVCPFESLRVRLLRLQLDDSGGAAAGAVDADGVRSAVAAIRAQGGPRVWVTTAGMSLLAFAIALQVGIGWLPALVAAAAQVVVTLFAALLGRFGVHRLFACAGQAVLAAALIGAAH